MKVNCISCGHGFGIDNAYCDYEGYLRCATCGFLLDVKIEDGLIRSVRPGNFSLQPQPAAAPAEPMPSVQSVVQTAVQTVAELSEVAGSAASPQSPARVRMGAQTDGADAVPQPHGADTADA